MDVPPFSRQDPLAPNKRGRNNYHHHNFPPHSSSSSPAPPPSGAFRPPPPPILKLAAGEVVFRILCPSSRIGVVIGKGDAIIRQFREETGAKIRIEDFLHRCCDERVIAIIADSSSSSSTPKSKRAYSSSNSNSTGTKQQGTEPIAEENSNGEDEGSPAQVALVRIFERILKVGEERIGIIPRTEKLEEVEEEKKEEGVGVGGNAGGGAVAPPPHATVVCRLLAPSSQVGCVLGRGGKIVERIRHESGAQVRVLTRDHIPPCALPGDELIQISGSFASVRKALFYVSGCLQDRSMADFHTADPFSRCYPPVPGSENGPSHRMLFEEEVVFKLFCQVDKVGSLIGKGGSVVRVLQNETGASIKIADAAPDSDEKVVVISARENSEQRHSPAQDAVVRVQSRIAEIGFEPGAAVVSRLLVHSQQLDSLWGNRGGIIGELTRITGASIRIFPKEQIPYYGSRNEEIVQIIGSLQIVQDALFHITSRLRETIFPLQRHFSGVSGSQYMSPYTEISSPLFRPRHDAASPGYPSPVGQPRGSDHVPVQSQGLEMHPAYSHGMDCLGPSYVDIVPHSYGSERLAHGTLVDRQSPPGSFWTPQAVANGNSGGIADVGGGFTQVPTGSGNQTPVRASTSVEVVVPQTLLSYVYGENNGNLTHIRQISGAKVVVHDPRAGATEGVVVISGTPDQTRVAQSLIQAFIFSEQNH